MSRAAIAEAVPIIELQQSIESSVSAISPFVERLMCFLGPLFRYFQRDEEDQFRVEIALREAVANAVIHGNGQNAGKRVYIACCCTLAGELLLSVGDEGPGFDVRAVADPTAPENLLLTHGRGLRLIRSFMDEVRFEKGGAVVRLRKRLGAEA